MSNQLMEFYRAIVQCKMFADCKYIEHHLYWSDMVDDDSYPTEEALNIIQKWGYYNKKQLFEFIKGLWHFKDFGWHETVDDEKTTYNISTGGWSGNEDLISALEHNHWLNWQLTWVQSMRGGHYIFEVKEDEFK